MRALTLLGVLLLLLGILAVQNGWHKRAFS